MPPTFLRAFSPGETPSMVDTMTHRTTAHESNPVAPQPSTYRRRILDAAAASVNAAAFTDQGDMAAGARTGR